MGLFKKIKKAVRKVTKPVKKVVAPPVKIVKPIAHKIISNPTRLGLAVGTLGGSEVIRKIPVLAPIQKSFEKVWNVAGGAIADSFTFGLYSAGQQTAVQLTAQKSEGNMGFNLGGFLGAVGGSLGAIQGANAGGVRAIGSVASVLGAGFSKPATAIAMTPARMSATPVMAMKPMVQAAAGRPLMRAGAAVGRGFFNKFPNLATALQNFRNAGMTQVTRGRLYSMLKRFGPELLVTGGILTAAASSELMVAGPGHRRMNPANVKALRRSVRRVESFHKLCRHVDVLRSRGKGKKCSTRGGSQQFVRQG